LSAAASSDRWRRPYFERLTWRTVCAAVAAGSGHDQGVPITPLVRRVTVAPHVSLHILDWVPEAPTDTDRPVFVLVHGLASNARMWDGVAISLATRGYRAIAIDQRGHGRSDKTDFGYDMSGVAHDLRTLLDELGLQRPVVAGQSWGANVVVEMAAAYPGRTRGVVPVDGGFIDLKSKFPDWDACRRSSQALPQRSSKAGYEARMLIGRKRASRGRSLTSSSEPTQRSLRGSPSSVTSRYSMASGNIDRTNATPSSPTRCFGFRLTRATLPGPLISAQVFSAHMIRWPRAGSSGFHPPTTTYTRNIPIVWQP
jgi:pimeloyl-ACP methyl ester carboxylesterase